MPKNKDENTDTDSRFSDNGEFFTVTDTDETEDFPEHLLNQDEDDVEDED
jgi:hypothetical protein